MLLPLVSPPAVVVVGNMTLRMPSINRPLSAPKESVLEEDVASAASNGLGFPLSMSICMLELVGGPGGGG